MNPTVKELKALDHLDVHPYLALDWSEGPNRVVNSLSMMHHPQYFPYMKSIWCQIAHQFRRTLYDARMMAMVNPVCNGPLLQPTAPENGLQDGLLKTVRNMYF